MINSLNHFPKVSIITPSFQQGIFLEETILSVLNQDYPNIEYLLIDGGSTDNSLAIIKKYQNKIAYWVSENDKGQADAINKGLKIATGDLLCWINSDDLLYPDFVCTRVKQFQAYPDLDFVYGDIHQGTEVNKKALRKGKSIDFHTMLTTVNVPVPQQSAMWRKTVLDKVGYLDEKWHVLLDREFFMRIARYLKTKYIPGAVAFSRNHLMSKSVNERIRWVEEIPKFYEEIVINNCYNLDSKYLKKISGIVLSGACLKSADIYHQLGHRKEYLKMVNRAKKLHFIYSSYILFKKQTFRILLGIKRILQKWG